MAHHELLDTVISQAEEAAAGAESPAEKAAAVLSSLHQQLQQRSTLGTFSGGRLPTLRHVIQKW